MNPITIRLEYRAKHPSKEMKLSSSFPVVVDCKYKTICRFVFIKKLAQQTKYIQSLIRNILLTPK